MSKKSKVLILLCMCLCMVSILIPCFSLPIFASSADDYIDSSVVDRVYPYWTVAQCKLNDGFGNVSYSTIYVGYNFLDLDIVFDSKSSSGGIYVYVTADMLSNISGYYWVDGYCASSYSSYWITKLNSFSWCNARIVDLTVLYSDVNVYSDMSKSSILYDVQAVRSAESMDSVTGFFWAQISKMSNLITFVPILLIVIAVIASGSFIILVKRLVSMKG